MKKISFDDFFDQFITSIATVFDVPKEELLRDHKERNGK